LVGDANLGLVRKTSKYTRNYREKFHLQNDDAGAGNVLCQLVKTTAADPNHVGTKHEARIVFYDLCLLSVT
jgi:hypothetical protein